MESNLTLNKKEADIFGLLFLEDYATILRCLLLNILNSGINTPVAVLEIVDYQGYLANDKKMEYSFAINF